MGCTPVPGDARRRPVGDSHTRAALMFESIVTRRAPAVVLAVALLCGVSNKASAQLGSRADTTHFAHLADALAYSAAEFAGIAAAPGRALAPRRRRLSVELAALPDEVRRAIARRLEPVLRDSVVPDSLGSAALRYTALEMRGDTARVTVTQRYRAGCPPLRPGQAPYRTGLGSSGATESLLMFVREAAGWRYAVRAPMAISDGVTECR